MNKSAELDVVWIVSFQIDETGRFVDYEIDQFDLVEHPDAVSKLTPLIGKGVFKTSGEARMWAEKQFSSSQSGCSGSGCGCGGGGCCHGK